MSNKQLLLELLRAESEATVVGIIKANPVLSDSENWKPLDGRKTNFNVTSNQASDGAKALTELITNMVDAVLTKHAYQKGIDPKGKEAPKTMYEAVDQLIKNMRGGKIVNLDPRESWLREFAEKNLVIGITGAKTKSEGHPCFTFVDNGEGQDPKNFETTFLSLSAGNKKDIPFVQGKYNMGSSGVLRYCGQRWYKLILSRRYDSPDSNWGWTLMRRRPASAGDMPIADYFAPRGDIPAFEQDIIFPFVVAGGDEYQDCYISSGTVIKLYDYFTGSRYSSLPGTREAFNENLIETILPFRLLDFRQAPETPKGKRAVKKYRRTRSLGIDSRPFYGMEPLLTGFHQKNPQNNNHDDGDVSGNSMSVGKITDPELGEIAIRAIVVEKMPSWLKGAQKINRIFHAVNGQVQYKQKRGAFTQYGFPALKDRVVLIVDASKVNFSAQNDIWKGDREHISNTITGERYQEEVDKIIRESKFLKDLQDRIARQELEHTAKAQSNTLFQKLVDADHNLAKLLSEKDPEIHVPAPGPNPGDGPNTPFEGKFSPTFIKFDKSLNKRGFADIHINKRRPIIAHTDAENNYLIRSDNCGCVILSEEVRKKFSVGQHLTDGRLVLYLEPIDKHLNVGDEIEFMVGLKDDAMPEAVQTGKVAIRIISKKVDAPPKPKPPAPPPEPSGDKNAPTHGLPKCVLLTKNGRDIEGYKVEKWPDGHSEKDGGIIDEVAAGEIIYKINYDNVWHLKYRSQQRTQVAKDVVTEKYILGMRILMLGFQHAFEAASKNNGLDDLSSFADEFRKMAARGAASTVLALAENLPQIIDATTARHEDD